MPVFLGVDGGQSTTKAVLADEHANILAQATGGPSDHTEEPGGREGFEQVIQTLIRSVLTSAKAPLTENAEFDGFGQKTQLTPVLFGRLGVNSPHELMAKYYSGQWSRDHLAGLAGWVHEAAEGGDLVAQTVLREAGRELAELALAVISLLFPFEKSQESTKDSEAPIVSYTGGVFRSQLVLSAMREVLLDKRPQAEIRPPLLPPVLGSLLLAYRCTGTDIASGTSETWLRTLARASRKQKDG